MIDVAETSRMLQSKRIVTAIVINKWR